MSVHVSEHVLYQIANTPIREYPYPHIYVESVFPDDFYMQMRQYWPRLDEMVCLNDTGRVTGNAYKERFISEFGDESFSRMSTEKSLFWKNVKGWLLTDDFRNTIIRKFSRYIPERFGFRPTRLDTTTEALLVRDLTNYAIRPHTDVPKRLVSLLFYCPEDNRYSHLGTSIYRPKDPDIDLDPSLHHPFNLFSRIATMEYKRNTLFAFMRMDDSYHGVEKIEDPDVVRDLLLYDIRIEKIVMPNVKISVIDRVLSSMIRKNQAK